MGLFDAGKPRQGAIRAAGRDVATVPNAVTGLRLLGLPLFAWLVLVPGRLWAGFAVLGVVATSDWVDGYLARRLGQVSKIGETFDPVVDRLLLIFTVATLLAIDAIPLALVLAVVIRDVVLLGGALLIFGTLTPMPVSRLGKTGTALLLFGVPGFLLAAIDWPGATVCTVLAYTFTGAGVVAYWAAGVDYARKAMTERRRGREGHEPTG